MRLFEAIIDANHRRWRKAKSWFLRVECFIIGIMQAYEEVVEFIAARSPREVIEFKPSEAARQRVLDLIDREKASNLSPEEKAELDHFMEVEHLMRLAKARARQLLAHEK